MFLRSNRVAELQECGMSVIAHKFLILYKQIKIKLFANLIIIHVSWLLFTYYNELCLCLLIY